MKTGLPESSAVPEMYALQQSVAAECRKNNGQFANAIGVERHRWTKGKRSAA